MYNSCDVCRDSLEKYLFPKPVFGPETRLWDDLGDFIWKN